MATPLTTTRTTLTTSAHRTRRALATAVTKLSRCEHHTDRTGAADLALALPLAARPAEFAGTDRQRRSTAAKRRLKRDRDPLPRPCAVRSVSAPASVSVPPSRSTR